jgi:flavin reductase (DIM6/NTAB) family NADH-FMN oxidoreductase RutF
MSSMAEFNTATLSPREVYPLLTAVVAPRPIALVSTLDSDGCGNLAPFSYFALGGCNPPSLVFCPLLTRDAQKKDTLLNIEETGEYVINIATLEMAQQLNQTSYPYPKGVDEFDRVGFTRGASVMVRPPRVTESPVQLEMRLFQIVRHGDGPLSSNYIIGEMVYLHVQDSVMVDGKPDNSRINHLARLGGEYYSSIITDNLFTIVRPITP